MLDATDTLEIDEQRADARLQRWTAVLFGLGALLIALPIVPLLTYRDYEARPVSGLCLPAMHPSDWGAVFALLVVYPALAIAASFRISRRGEPRAWSLVLWCLAVHLVTGAVVGMGAGGVLVGGLLTLVFAPIWAVWVTSVQGVFRAERGSWLRRTRVANGIRRSVFASSLVGVAVCFVPHQVQGTILSAGLSLLFVLGALIVHRRQHRELERVIGDATLQPAPEPIAAPAINLGTSDALSVSAPEPGAPYREGNKYRLVVRGDVAAFKETLRIALLDDQVALACQVLLFAIAVALEIKCSVDLSSRFG